MEQKSRNPAGANGGASGIDLARSTICPGYGSPIGKNQVDGKSNDNEWRRWRISRAREWTNAALAGPFGIARSNNNGGMRGGTVMGGRRSGPTLETIFAPRGKIIGDENGPLYRQENNNFSFQGSRSFNPAPIDLQGVYARSGGHVGFVLRGALGFEAIHELTSLGRFSTRRAAITAISNYLTNGRPA